MTPEEVAEMRAYAEAYGAPGTVLGTGPNRVLRLCDALEEKERNLNSEWTAHQITKGQVQEARAAHAETKRVLRQGIRLMQTVVYCSACQGSPENGSFWPWLEAAEQVVKE